MPDTIAATSERLDPLLQSEGASEYDRATMALHLERYRLAAEYVAGRHVVDCACGTGYGSHMMADAGAQTVQGVDRDAATVEYARTHHAVDGVRYVAGDAMSFSAEPAADVWVSLETIEHLPDPRGYIRHVASQLAPGARLIASVPVTVSTDGNPHHLWDFTARSFRALLVNSGFRVERELRQLHRFTLSDITGDARGARQKDRRGNLIAWYAAHPVAFARRVWLTLTRGFVHEYLTIVAVRVGPVAGGRE